MVSDDLVPCAGCGALVADSAGPTHRYLGASAGCWAIFGELLAKEQEFARTVVDQSRYQAVHRLAVDAYCVQHPGLPSRRTIQSVAVHLISLHVMLERGADAQKALRVIRRALSHRTRFHWLEPPAFMGAITVVEVNRAEGFAAHARLVEEWARASWEAWAQHHEQIRRWASL